MKKLKSFAELKDLTQADVGEVCIASLRDVVENAINDASNKYADKIKDEEKAKTEALTKAQAAEDKTKELEAKVKEDEDKIKDIETKLQTAEAKEAQRTKDEMFQRHMWHVAETFELNEKQSKAVATQIKDLDEDKFNAWLVDFEVFAAKKAPKDEKHMTDEEKKKMKEKMDKEKMGAKATDEEIAKATQDALDEAKAKQEALANTRDAGKTDGKSWMLGEGIELVK